MKLVGVTGGIGMGKSACAGILQKRGLPVVDTDTIAHEIVEPGKPALEEIKAAFGGEILGADGRLRRGELAKKVFIDQTALRKLEDILHPRIREIWVAQAERWKVEGQGIGFVVIPLLYETNAASQFDHVICVACSGETQRKRLRGRGWTDEQLQRRIDAQWPAIKKMDAAHFVIWTETTMEAHAAQVEYLLSHHLL